MKLPFLRGNLSGVQEYLSFTRPDSKPSVPVKAREGRMRSTEFRLRARSTGRFYPPVAVDQTDVTDILTVLGQMFLPFMTDDDIQTVWAALDLIDEVLLNGLKDAKSWVVPKDFADIPFVKEHAAKGVPLEIILKDILDGLRLMIWLYPQDLGSLVPSLVELEDVLAVLTAELKPEPKA